MQTAATALGVVQFGPAVGRVRWWIGFCDDPAVRAKQGAARAGGDARHQTKAGLSLRCWILAGWSSLIAPRQVA
jgi:hypothetical protein